MHAKDMAKEQINRVAETHFFLKLGIEKVLKNTLITDQGKKYMLGSNNYFDYWIKISGNYFFDMGTIIRLGTAIEIGLKYYYMWKRGLTNLLELSEDVKDVNVFQRLMPWNDMGVINLFLKKLKIDLNENFKIKNLQEIILYRHLYAHNSGLLNHKFVSDYKKLLGYSISKEVLEEFLEKDIFYFKPLENLNVFIEDSRSFFEKLPN